MFHAKKKLATEESEQIDITYPLLFDHVKNRDLQLVWIHTVQRIVDALTKLLSTSKKIHELSHFEWKIEMVEQF